MFVTHLKCIYLLKAFISVSMLLKETECDASLIQYILDRVLFHLRAYTSHTKTHAH